MIPSAPIRAVLAEFMAKYGEDREIDAWTLLAERMGYTDGKSAQGSIPRILARDHVESGRHDFDPIAWVDRLLVALDAPHVWAQLDQEHDPGDLETIEEHDATCGDCGRIIDWANGEDLAVRIELRIRRRWWWWTLCGPCWATISPRPRKPDCTGVIHGSKIPDDKLLELYRAYCLDKLGLAAIIEREHVVERHGYPNVPAAATSITKAWRDWGWPMYDKSTSKRLNGVRRRAGGRIGHRIGADDLRKLHVLHVKGEKLSANELAKRTYAKYGYKTHSSCHRAILDGWKALGLNPRDRLEMTVEMSTKNGLSPRDHRERYRLRREAGLTNKGKQPRPTCVGSTAKGGRCVARSAAGSDYCYQHDPANADTIARHLAEMRRRSPLQNRELLDFDVIRDELVAAREWLGSWEAVAAAVGLSPSTLKTYAATRNRRISVEKVAELRTKLAAATAPQEQAA